MKNNMRQKKTTEEKLGIHNIMINYLIEFIAIFFWVYLFIKLLICDFDVILMSLFLPKYLWILHYKFFIIIGFFALILIFCRNKVIIEKLLYILFYPVILIIWKIPRKLFLTKSWIAMFAFIGGVLNFVKSFKFNFISFAFLSISSILTIKLNNPYILIITLVYFVAYLIVIYLRSLYLSFKPSSLFSIQADTLDKIREKFQLSFNLDKEIKPLSLDAMTEKQLSKWSNSLQQAIIYNRVCYFISSKLRAYKKSKINIAFYILSFLFLMCLTVYLFGFINFAFYKIEPSAYQVYENPTILHFIYYSINTLLTNNIPDFYPVTALARFINTFETSIAIILVIILFFLFTTVQNEKQNEEIDTVIETIKNHGQKLEPFVKSEYRLTVPEAIEELKKIKASSVQLIIYLSDNISKDLIGK